MAALPVASGDDVVRALGKVGFVLLARRGKGSHTGVFRRDPAAIITVPSHKELRRGTLRAIIRQAGLTVDEFVELMKG
jgi:predicted RNA binding protein YcfA (HicA-like mRNA interferase family)